MAITSPAKLGRNSPCHCGSGKKYKHCCLPTEKTPSPDRLGHLGTVRTVAQALQLALSYHQQGDVAKAEPIYRQVLEVEPENPDALHLLGLVVQQAGDRVGGVELVRRAIALKGGVSYYYNNLANMLRERKQPGDVSEAVTLYHEAIRLQPDYAEAHGNLGVALESLGDLDGAITSYNRAIELRPELAESHFHAANALRVQNRLEEAAREYREAIQLQPAYADAYNNLGIVLRDQGDLVGSLSCYREAVRLRPDFAGAHNNLGMALHQQGDLAGAIAAYRDALRLQPEHAEAQSNLGIALQLHGDLAGAEESLREALRIRPDYAEASNNLAVVLHAAGNYPGAIEQCRAALHLKPGYVEAASNLMYQLQMTCDWPELEDTWDLTKGLLREDPARAVDPFTLVIIPSSPAEQRAFAESWARNRLAGAQQLRDTLNFRLSRASGAKLRIGYLSADYHEHATAYLIAELFELHDRDRFEVFAYSIGRSDVSPMRQRLMAGCDHFVDLQHLSFMAAAEQIYADRIDILVDLKGYTRGSRTEIMALRPAPIQVNYLGYPGTMGADFIDYILTDRFVTPPEEQQHFAEEVVYLPDCYQVNDRKRLVAEHTPSRAECGLPEEGLVFCSFNNTYKVTPQMFDIWMRILHQTPGSVLWLLESNRWVAGNLRREAEARGVDPARLVFAPPRPLAEHLARYRLADLFLDTFPVNAHTTASDALWVGVPVVTCAGDTFVSRVAGSLLTAIGLPELIATSLQEYEALALWWAQRPEELAKLKLRLAENRDTKPLFDSERFTHNLEAAYQSMWRRADLPQAPEAPARIDLGVPETATKYNVTLLQPPDYLHSMALWDIGELLLHSFQSLGREATLTVNHLDQDAVNVLLGYHLLADPALPAGYRCIVYQLEQLEEGDGWLRANPAALQVLRQAHEVWDYSPENAAFLRARGISNVRLLPIGFHPKLHVIPSVEQDIDVLFYGSVNERRQKILEELAGSCRLEAVFGKYGAERDAYIARSKIVLNMHVYRAQILEQARISYLLNNRRFVVSESSLVNPYEGFLVTAPYEDLARTCLRYLEDEVERARLADEGFARFRERPMAEFLRAVIPPLPAAGLGPASPVQPPGDLLAG